MSVILETRQLCKFYGAGENQVKAVNQVDIQIEQGEFVMAGGTFSTMFLLFFYARKSTRKNAFEPGRKRKDVSIETQVRFS